MRDRDVIVGAVYAVKVSGTVQPVRIGTTSPYGGWNAVNLATDRAVRLRSARRLRERLCSVHHLPVAGGCPKCNDEHGEPPPF